MTVFVYCFFSRLFKRVYRSFPRGPLIISEESFVTLVACLSAVPLCVMQLPLRFLAAPPPVAAGDELAAGSAEAWVPWW